MATGRAMEDDEPKFSDSSLSPPDHNKEEEEVMVNSFDDDGAEEEKTEPREASSKVRTSAAGVDDDDDDVVGEGGPFSPASHQRLLPSSSDDGVREASPTAKRPSKSDVHGRMHQLGEFSSLHRWERGKLG